MAVKLKRQFYLLWGPDTENAVNHFGLIEDDGKLVWGAGSEIVSGMLGLSEADPKTIDPNFEITFRLGTTNFLLAAAKNYVLRPEGVGANYPNDDLDTFVVRAGWFGGIERFWTGCRVSKLRIESGGEGESIKVTLTGIAEAVTEATEAPASISMLPATLPRAYRAQQLASTMGGDPAGILNFSVELDNQGAAHRNQNDNTAGTQRYPDEVFIEDEMVALSLETDEELPDSVTEGAADLPAGGHEFEAVANNGTTALTITLGGLYAGDDIEQTAKGSNGPASWNYAFNTLANPRRTAGHGLTIAEA